MTVATAFGAAIALGAWCITGCAPLPPEHQARIDRALAVACLVDGAVVPIAQPVVGALGPAGATAQAVDQLLVHPAVVGACAARNGRPVAVEVLTTKDAP